ncbi:MAG: prepilin-type N-terminal cleavage/methylation domain-containing protein [Xanthomonadales bacterium]|nr:prepilin-type N-terminal cleavage/methylation domain-containing protein [Gammaproteobacteria bacterium]MBT8073261.1 prepilin-type N-terminal cleavage/methylation domain-containing protein [Gammaproteobacteria bacterium]MBT8075388.1 prepilin-type N-terminal cleavage/methylation domain-containing protein [Gammaproteobacteria bacterium]NNK04105.1 prepilin-type N-terminal cleavage/methylation domain-containing protein [Xanthomonadales bacterium]NNK98501.1 prepilin-type N-terminal cleavage/methyl
MKNGFSLIELMIVTTLIAILATLSYPSYVSFIRKADRTEAMTTLLDWANRQQIWRADHPAYSTGINPDNTELYSYSMTTTATSFTLTATALNEQAYDKEDGVSCGTLTLDQSGQKGPSGHLECWGK